MRKTFLIAAALCLVWANTACALGAWNLNSDWSTGPNPSGQWAYGISSGDATNWIGDYTVYLSSYNLWALDGSDPDWPFPYLFKALAGNPWGVPTDMVGGHTRTNTLRGNGAKWTAPGDIHVNLSGWACNAGSAASLGASLAVNISGVPTVLFYNVPLVNGVHTPSSPLTLADAITAYGGDPGSLQNIHMSAGDSLWLVVNPLDGTQHFGMDLTVTEVPEPGALCALSVGLVGFLGLIRRRH